MSPLSPLSKLRGELQFELDGLNRECKANIASMIRKQDLESWIEQLVMIDGSPAGQLSFAVRLLDVVARKLDPTRRAGLESIAITYVKHLMEVLDAEAKLDASLANANRLAKRPCKAPVGIESLEDDADFCDLYEASEQAHRCAAGACAYVDQNPATSADAVSPEPPRSADSEFSKGGGR